MPKLTKRTVDSLKPEHLSSARDYFVWDEALPGFGIRVRPNGRKIYVLQYRDPAGSTRRIVIGEHGPYTPEQARTEAARQRADVLVARRDPAVPDPARRRRAARQVAQATLAAPTVAELADVFLPHAAAKLKASTVAEYRRLLTISPIRRGPAKGKVRIGEIRRALGRFKVADVTRAQVSKLHLSMKDRPYMANRALAALSALFTYAELQGNRPEGSNPCRGVSEFPEHKRERLLTDAEYASLGESMRRAETQGLPLPSGRDRRKATARTAKHRTKRFDKPTPSNPVGLAALRFLVLTGWRKSEALSLKWTDVDFERGAATLADTKTGRSHREIGAPALALLDDVKAFRHEGNPYVFPGTKRGAYFTDVARLWNSVRHAASLSDVRLHDLRHGYASVGLQSGLTLPVIGALLGHSDIATTARYTHIADSARKRAADLTSEAVAIALASRDDSETRNEASTPMTISFGPRRRS
jgi:integrase